MNGRTIAIADAYTAGESVAAIAERYGVTPQTVRCYGSHYGLARRPWGGASMVERRAEIVRRYQSGMSITEVAAIVGVSKQAVSVHLTKAGVTERHFRNAKRNGLS